MPNCVTVDQLYVLVGYLYFLLPPTALLLPKEIIFCIYIMALCLNHYLCQLYMVPLLQLCLMMLLDLLLLQNDWY